MRTTVGRSCNRSPTPFLLPGPRQPPSSSSCLPWLHWSRTVYTLAQPLRLKTSLRKPCVTWHHLLVNDVLITWSSRFRLTLGNISRRLYDGDWRVNMAVASTWQVSVIRISDRSDPAVAVCELQRWTKPEVTRRRDLTSIFWSRD